MNKTDLKNRSLLPAFIMVLFTILLIVALIFRVYRADRDLGMLRIGKRQARLAAESGANFAIEKIREILSSTARVSSPETISASFFDGKLPIGKWFHYGLKTDAQFKILGVRKIASVDNKATPLINEGLRFQVIAEGKSQGNRYSISALVQLYDLVNTFAVFNSLNEYYYGTPFQPWIETAHSSESFRKANKQIISRGLITNRGICHDPNLLFNIFRFKGKSPFKSAKTGNEILDNYSRAYLRAGTSPCMGPLYCDSPIVIDTHTFWGPLQTSLYVFRRKGAKPRIDMNSTAYTVNSSMRLQIAAGKLEGKNVSNLIVDRDTPMYSSMIPSWKPDFSALKSLAKRHGIYIDSTGKGFYKGNPIDVDYHASKNHIYSDSYKSANSTSYEQDNIKEKYIVLSTDSRFNNVNNISASALNGSAIIYSERAIYIRGDIGNDLVIATPEHIYITGPTNVDSALNLFLIAKQGVALSTVDLENYIAKKQPGNDFIDAAREWIIRAIIYKPGAGVYTAIARPQKQDPISFIGLFGGKSLKIKIIGACLEGNLTRWINNTELGGLTINWNPSGINRLPIRPVVANILRTQTKSE